MRREKERNRNTTDYIVDPFFGAAGPSSQQAVAAATAAAAAATVRSLWAIRHARNTTSKLIFNLKMIHKMVRAFREGLQLGRPAQVAAGCEEQ